MIIFGPWQKVRTPENLRRPYMCLWEPTSMGGYLSYPHM
jgi:hypothetical protein